MDRKFYMDNFERLLQEKADEFRMYPSEKIWHSIYNNIFTRHKWPSAIMGIVLIALLPLIGILNTKTIPPAAIDKNIAFNTIAAPVLFAADNVPEIALPATHAELYKPVPDKFFAKKRNQQQQPKKNGQLQANYILSRLPVNTLYTKPDIVSTGKEYAENSLKPAATEQANPNNINSIVFEKNIAAKNYALQNMQLSQKWTDKLALQIYASPSIIYGISAGPQTMATAAEAQAASSISNQNVGLEAGTAMQYSLSTILKVKAGLQFNYASYDIAAYQNGHSGAAPLISTEGTSANMDMLARVSDYSSTVSPSTLHNEMYQFSLPIGLELKLARYNNFQWNAGATIQPTYIAGGNAYLLSSDSHIDESALINRWNLNAGLETFVTYKVNDITWQLGPQFRYQFSSTYGKAYSGMDEKLAIFGVKIGITKVLH